jgi:hypothetical protein
MVEKARDRSRVLGDKSEIDAFGEKSLTEPPLGHGSEGVIQPVWCAGDVTAYSVAGSRATRGRPRGH